MAPGLLIANGDDLYNSSESPKLDTAEGYRRRAKPSKSGLLWDSNTFFSSREYTYELNTEDKAEVHSALLRFKNLGLDGNEVDSNNFQLPTLGKVLHRCAAELHSGRGFVNVRGLDPSHYSPEDNVIIYLGISSYIGEKRAKQDEDGNMLMHICDAKNSNALQQDRPTRFSRRASTFHTDTFCDIIALQTRSCAAKGGRHILSSALTVCNKLAALRPDLFELLKRPIWSFDSRGILFDCNTRPLLYCHEGKMILNFAREPLLGLAGVARTDGLPDTSTEQKEALDLIEALAKESQITLSVQPGDLTFINNHAILHSRESYEDGPGATRYLVRMWLKNPAMAWNLPHQLQIGNSRIYEENEITERWNIIPTPKLRFKMSERLSS